ncbi:hypothetical protein LSPH24S_09986 [Lysinibacillus sphaericus]
MIEDVIAELLKKLESESKKVQPNKTNYLEI